MLWLLLRQKDVFIVKIDFSEWTQPINPSTHKPINPSTHKLSQHLLVFLKKTFNFHHILIEKGKYFGPGFFVINVDIFFCKGDPANRLSGVESVFQLPVECCTKVFFQNTFEFLQLTEKLDSFIKIACFNIDPDNCFRSIKMKF